MQGFMCSTHSYSVCGEYFETPLCISLRAHRVHDKFIQSLSKIAKKKPSPKKIVERKEGISNKSNLSSLATGSKNVILVWLKNVQKAWKVGKMQYILGCTPFYFLYAHMLSPKCRKYLSIFNQINQSLYQMMPDLSGYYICMIQYRNNFL